MTSTEIRIRSSRALEEIRSLEYLAELIREEEDGAWKSIDRHVQERFVQVKQEIETLRWAIGNAQ